ncbi:MAG: glycerol-3-phosphate 1-O-acyltransferase PlsY [Phycisphaeraceae bacterium]|nr:glycerol-3-phosphate 1-O-acyltransferase PlsY [Phycisphaeraceae bacterium]
MNTWWLWVLLAYLAGSLPFGLWIGWSKGVDVRKSGSGNVGATNVGRVLGKKWGILCFVLDLLKGLLSVLLVGGLEGWWCDWNLPTTQAWRWLAVGAAAVLGHVFPVWLKFRGGKGVATSLGVLLAYYPILTWPGVGALVTWVVLMVAFRYVSLASIVGAVLLPVYLLVEGYLIGRSPASLQPFLIVTGLLAVLVVLRHRTNIQRLLAGTENKVGNKQA